LRIKEQETPLTLQEHDDDELHPRCGYHWSVFREGHAYADKTLKH
jgi:hypothetical protein